MRTRYISLPSTYPILRSWRRYLNAGGLKEGTIAGYVRNVGLLLDFLAASGVAWDRASHHDIERWMEDELVRTNQNSARTRWVSGSYFYKWAFEEGEVKASPFTRARPPKRVESDKDIVPPEKVSECLAALKKAGKWRDAALVALFYDTGLRAGEVQGLLLEDVDEDTNIVRIRKETSKGTRFRLVRISDPTMAIIDRYLRRRKKPCPYLIAGQRGQMTTAGLWQVIRRSFLAVGVAHIGPHDLRHTSATYQVGEMSESELMALFGWRDSAMVRHYAKARINQAALEAHRRSSPMERLGR